MKRLKHHIHKPNWFWVENFHGEEMKTLNHNDFKLNTTFYEKWSDLYFVDTKSSNNTSTFKLTVPITYHQIVSKFGPQGSDCKALFVSTFSSAFYKELEKQKVKGKIYIDSCTYTETDGSTVFDVTYSIG